MTNQNHTVPEALAALLEADRELTREEMNALTDLAEDAWREIADILWRMDGRHTS